MLAPLTLKTVRAWVSEPLLGRFWVSKGRMEEEEEEEEKKKEKKERKEKKRKREDSRGENGCVLVDT